MREQLNRICKEETANQERGGAKRIPRFLKSLSELTEKGSTDTLTANELTRYRNAVNSLCKAEIAYLRSKLSGKDGVYSTQTLHRYVSDYRNAVRDAFDGLPMPEYYGDARGRKQRTHIAVKYLTMTKAEKVSRKAADITAKNSYTDIDTQGRLVISGMDQLIVNATDLLKHATGYFDIAAALLAVTGRRPIEILSTASLTASEPHQCLFSGQAKTRESKHARDDFNIYVLASPVLVENAIAKLRKMKTFPGLNNRQIESRTSGSLGVAVREHFGEVLEHGGLVTPKGLRGIWVNVAHHIFKPMSIESVFATLQLGHATPTGQSVSRASADNYMQYFAYQLSREKIAEYMAIIA